MGKFLALIVASAMVLFIAGPAMAQGWDVSKTYTFEKDNTVTGNTNINVDKDIDIDIDGDLEATDKEDGDGNATGGIEVQGDVVFKELDVQVQDEEVVSKFFELDDSASSTWFAGGTGFMAVAEQLQNGDDNVARIHQTNQFSRDSGLHVGLQYQVGDFNAAQINQTICHHEMNNFAKQIQIGVDNLAFGQQD